MTGRVMPGCSPKEQAGVTVPLVALMIVTLFVIAALAIDLGVAYTGRTTAQHAADAAALAGAYTYVSNPTLSGTDRVDAAFRDAAAVANTYKVLGYRVNVNSSASTYEACTSAENIICVDEARRRVTAVVAVPVQTYFGRVLRQFAALQVKATANAEAAPNAAGERCIKPIYVSNDAIAPEFLVPTGSGGKVTAEDYQNKCIKAYSNGHTIFGPDGKLTDWANSYIAAQKDFTGSSALSNPSSCYGSSGCPVPLLEQYSPNPSQWGVVDFSAGQGNGAYGGSSLVACTMQNCLQECNAPKPMYDCGDPVVGLNTGNRWGQIQPLQAAVQNAQAKYVDVGNYEDNPSPWPSSSDTSPSLISVLVWDCRQTVPNGTQGEITVGPTDPLIMGVAQVFVNKVSDKNTNIFLVGGGTCGTSGGSGPGAIPVRLVNVP